MNRRDFIRGAAGLLVAAGAGELLLPERRPMFALDRTMLGGTDALYAEWRDLTAHVNGTDIRYTAQVTPPPFSTSYRWEIVLDGRRYPVATPEDIKQVVAFERKLIVH